MGNRGDIELQGSAPDPVFLVGMPRSGTTLIFEALCARGDLAWISQHVARWPRFPSLSVLSRIADVTPAARRSVGVSDQVRSHVERLRVGPSEAYGLWERCVGRRFRYDYMLGERAEEREAARVRRELDRVRRWHGRSRLALKLTGPGRIAYLSSIYPDAVFVHVVRDGRAVTSSLLNVHFWQTRSRTSAPAWENGLTPADLDDLESSGYPELALAAVQWRRVVETTRLEGSALDPGAYTEIHYESFVSSPGDDLDRLADFCSLPRRSGALEFMRSRVELQNRNDGWRGRFSADEMATLDALLGPTLSSFGYEV